MLRYESYNVIDVSAPVLLLASFRCSIDEVQSTLFSMEIHAKIALISIFFRFSITIILHTLIFPASKFQVH